MNICRKKIEIEVNEEDPWAEDLLKRKAVAEDFSRLVNDISQPFVLAVNSPYGTGKTFFLKRWAADLKQNKNNIAVFFNAWSTDFEEDPIIPFMDTILKELPRDKINTLSKKAKELLVSIKDYGNFVAECFGGPEQAAEKFWHVLNPLEDYEKKLNLITSFKQEVAKVIGKKKLLIFVDELERCRPTYAVETLEVIKHLFDIENVIFILGIDRIQLQSTIANLYGSDMDKDGYLRRFIDLELTLPEPDLKDFCSMLCKEFEIKNENAADEENYTNGWTCFCEYFSKLATAYKLSLREANQCFTSVKIMQSIVPETTLKLMPILAWLLILKCKRPNIFLAIDSMSCEDLIKEYTTHNKSIGNDEFYFSDNMIAMIRLIKTKNLDNEIQQTIDEIRRIQESPIKDEQMVGKIPELEKKRKNLEKAHTLWDGIKHRYYFTDHQNLLTYLVKLVKYVGVK